MIPLSEFQWPDLEVSWELCMAAIKNQVPSAVLGKGAGLAKLRERYAAKWERLGPYFGPDGRIVDSVQAKCTEWNAVHKTLFGPGADLPQRALLLAEKPQFLPLKQHGNVLSLVRWLERILLAMHTPQEVAENRAQFGKQTVTVSKLVRQTLKDIPCFGYHFDNDLLADYPYALKPLITEFVGVLFSRVREVLKHHFSSTRYHIVLSINPFDILTCSLHTTGWSSCQVVYGGEHSTAPFAYLCDPNTAIAYVFYKINRFQGVGVSYPVKYWRQFVYFAWNDRAVLHGRHYPSYYADFAQAARKLSTNVLAKHFNISHRWNVRADIQPPPLGEETYAGIHSQPAYYHVSNLGWIYLDPPREVLHMTEGGRWPVLGIGARAIPCLRCAKTRESHREYNHRSLTCLSCTNTLSRTLRCYKCNIEIESPPYIANGYAFCQRHFEELYTNCALCEGIFPRINITNTMCRECRRVVALNMRYV